jgi:UDP-N-acetylmuramate dehydrogenase
MTDTKPKGLYAMETQIKINQQKTTEVPSIITCNVPLYDKNWFCTGGPAKFYCAPTTIQEFQQALAWCNTQQCPLHILGQGANTLISDDGFDGLVIRPLLHDIQCINTDTNSCLITAGSGVTIHDLIVYCLDHTILGLEEFSGIPGTVGGSVYNNLHYFEYSLADFLVSAQIIDRRSGAVLTIDKDWLAMSYDHSKLHEKQQYLLNATFKLKQATPLEAAYAKGRRTEIIRHRVKRYPMTHTCGSFFRNFHEHEVHTPVNGKKLIFIAYYLDNVGIKGNLRIGNATVSHQHANMIVTLEHATSSDVVAVARTMQEKVYKAFGLLPQSECELVGFKKHPLLTWEELQVK